jgi:hypothetical protein
MVAQYTDKVRFFELIVSSVQTTCGIDRLSTDIEGDIPILPKPVSEPKFVILSSVELIAA